MDQIELVFLKNHLHRRGTIVTSHPPLGTLAIDIHWFDSVSHSTSTETLLQSYFHIEGYFTVTACSGKGGGRIGSSPRPLPSLDGLALKEAKEDAICELLVKLSNM